MAQQGTNFVKTQARKLTHDAIPVARGFGFALTFKGLKAKI